MNVIYTYKEILDVMEVIENAKNERKISREFMIFFNGLLKKYVEENNLNVSEIEFQNSIIDLMGGEWEKSETNEDEKIFNRMCEMFCK